VYGMSVSLAANSWTGALGECGYETDLARFFAMNRGVTAGRTWP
jgi:hypothetical protein